MAASAASHSFAVFPFLKTSAPVRLPGTTLYSTDDTGHLSPEDAAHVSSIAAMLFAQDDLQIKSATYATIPAVDLDRSVVDIEALERLQTVIAYSYTTPHPHSGDPFLFLENASLIILSPQPVSIYLVRPEHHTIALTPSPIPPNERHEVPGYHGLYNFRHHFWVSKGSRVYPPVPQITLNISQDIAGDMQEILHSARYGFLPFLLTATDPMSLRVLTALRWFNKATTLDGDDEAALLHLAVAFEALLGLPQDEKTDRLTDAIALLLGRVHRLDSWARQFYAARSRITHEGRTSQLRFVTDPKRPKETQVYHPLLSFGRQVFQLAASTLMHGAQLAMESRLEEHLVTNQERFERVVVTLADTMAASLDRLQKIAPDVSSIVRYQYLSESSLRLETMAGAARLAATALLSSGGALPEDVAQAFTRLAEAKRSGDEYETLSALASLQDVRKQPGVLGSDIPGLYTTIQLSDAVWHYTFMYYFALERQRAEKEPKQPVPKSG